MPVLTGLDPLARGANREQTLQAVDVRQRILELGHPGRQRPLQLHHPQPDLDPRHELGRLDVSNST